MRTLLLLVLGCSVGLPAAAAVYRYVDEAGNVTYSDRPQRPYQEALRLPPPNVATPEARRQLEIARQASEREARAEYEAGIRRWSAVQRAVPASYSRPSQPRAPGAYSLPLYYPYAYPSFNTFSAASNAGNSRQNPAPHRAHHARR